MYNTRGMAWIITMVSRFEKGGNTVAFMGPLLRVELAWSIICLADRRVTSKVR
jgi:hypothetical protein